MSAYVQDTQFFTRRTAVLIAIIALHVLILYALATGLMQKAVRLAAPPIQTQIVRQVHKHLPPPPPPPPQLVQPQVQVPPPLIQINVPAAQSHAITVTKHVVTAPPAPPPAPPATYTPPQAGRGFPRTQSYYPESSRRLGEQGTATVNICIGPNGRLTSAPRLIRSSGSPRLDRAALRYARATSGHWIPEKRNGVPISSCAALPIKFRLADF
ncbi:MAG: energy transducer TonB [Steroidobacteraceae bacterium]